MGAVCCCLNVGCEDFTSPNGAISRHCICLQCFTQNFFHMYTSLFRREEDHVIPSTSQGTTSLSSVTSSDNSLAEMYSAPPRPLPYDTDPRYIRDGLVSKREKASGHSQEEMEPLRRNQGNDDSSTGSKWNESKCEEGSKEYDSKISSKASTAKITNESSYTCSSSDEEDVCPTCLEDYTEENPRIITKCSHHYHLGCIYEWMERSDRCPVCGKVMVFDETT